VGYVALGALAGLALGLVVADRLGGIDGLRRRLRRPAGASRLATPWEHSGPPDGLDEFSAHEFADGWDDEVDDFDAGADDESAPAARRRGPVAHAGVLPPEELEARVLEVFRNDPKLAECAIDISADEDGGIELAGWVSEEGDIAHALTLARGVPDIGNVVSLLAVKPSEA
jgi:hypothetical protein